MSRNALPATSRRKVRSYSLSAAALETLARLAAERGLPMSRTLESLIESGARNQAPAFGAPWVAAYSNRLELRAAFRPNDQGRALLEKVLEIIK